MARSSFSAQVKNWSGRTRQSLELISKTVKVEMFSRLIYRSPVGNPDLWEFPAPKGYVGGRFRGAWNVDEPRITDDVDPAGAETESRMHEAVFANQPFRLTSYINGLPYSEALEHGHSSQAPLGIVRVAALEFPAVVEAAAAQYRV